MFGQTGGSSRVPLPSWNLVADFQQIFQYEFMQNAFIAGTIVAILAGVVGYFVVLRRLGFASEALAHGGFAGATGAVVLGQDVFLGLLAFTSITGAFMGVLGDRLRGRLPFLREVSQEIGTAGALLVENVITAIPVVAHR